MSLLLWWDVRLACCALEIISPAPGEVVYQNENLLCRAIWNNDSLPAPEGNVLFRWSSDVDGQLGEGLKRNITDLSYRRHELTCEAVLGDSVIARAKTNVTVIVRPVQFTLSERNDWEGEFSRQGTRAAFTSFRFGEPEILIASVANRAVSRITYQGGMAPSWSADGHKLVFWSERTGGRNLWLVDLTEGPEPLNAVKLTSDTASDWMPAFSPVDSRVVYVSKQGKRLSLKTLDADERGLEPLEILGPEHQPMFPRWFSDGEEILFTSYRHTQPAIYRLSLKNGFVIQLTDPGAEDADVSPDGKLIVMVRGGEIWLHRLNDNYERPLTNEHAGAISPRFSPDCEKVIYASSLSGNYDLWILDLPKEN
ncbi:MAG TPA: hypothetical protein VM123_18395 [archaeon]|nr:hypothetical protein [archaeon]